MSDNITVDITAQGVDRISRMKDQVAMVHASWRNYRPEWVSDMTLSFGRHVADLMTWGRGVEVCSDGDLSLFVKAPPIVFGLIFHGKHHQVSPPPPDAMRFYGTPAPREGLFCMTATNKERGVCAEPYRGGERTCEGHDALPVAMPVPGTWSFHS
jgi:hypothetical protein